jgi:hypothetical protein
MEEEKGWKTIMGEEAKSRIYLTLLGRKEPLNVFKLEPIFNVSGQFFHGYTRPYIEVTLKEMAREETVEPEIISEEGKRPVNAYRANPDVYLDFLNDCADVPRERLKEVRKVILGFGPLWNKIGPGDIPGVDALLEIGICGACPTHFSIDTPKEEFMVELFRWLKKVMQVPMVRPLKFLPIPFKPMAYTIVDRLYSYPKVELDKALIDEASNLREVFLTGVLATGCLIPGGNRRTFKKAMRYYDQFMKKLSHQLGHWSGYPASSQKEKPEGGGKS